MPFILAEDVDVHESKKLSTHYLYLYLGTS